MKISLKHKVSFQKFHEVTLYRIKTNELCMSCGPTENSL